ncbi:uncharacterized protein LOC100201425 [Hydra vulgaris]|uniref:Uncharacterized protein LOC100201425 n=1 Tax=Hydra vulgaris TaxID=6087 RepID=A0ABM4DQ29_HYDVU
MKLNYIMAFKWFQFIFLVPYIFPVQNQICNGMKELCNLRIDQVTLAGSHNSGAGFNGFLYYHKVVRVPALSCAYKNQRLSITGQLDLGVRYFDIDVCWDTFYKPESPWTCHQRAFGGSIKAILEQINNWMNKNRNDVVVLHFNRDATDPEKAGPAVMKQILDLWGAPKAGELAIQTNKYATLGQSILDNKRIYIIMAQKLTNNIADKSNYINEHDVGFTWTSKHGATQSDAKELIEEMGENRCERETFGHFFVRYDLYLTWGLCNDDLAALVKPFIRQGTSGCYTGTSRQKKTVNFILVDYVDEEVVNVANDLNKINIKNFMG